MTYHKIYFNGYKRQLIELYYFLKIENHVSCELDEFMGHFTGKKWPDSNKKHIGDLNWNGERYLLITLIKNLAEKGFVDGSIESYFICRSSSKQMSRLKTKRFVDKLNSLFPEKSGYRCKQRLFYRARNKESLVEVLKNCGISISMKA